MVLQFANRNFAWNFCEILKKWKSANLEALIIKTYNIYQKISPELQKTTLDERRSNIDLDANDRIEIFKNSTYKGPKSSFFQRWKL